MALFIIHSLILGWSSVGAARRIHRSITDRLLVAPLLVWANIVVTSLVLSLVHKLGDSLWFFATSSLLAGTLNLVLIALKPEPPSQISNRQESKDKLNIWLLGAFMATLIPVVLALVGIAYSYAPNSTGTLTHELPRALYYLGQNSLRQFDTFDLRQIYLPFNYNLLLLFGAIYSPPWQCLNLINLVAWGISGVATYRLCRLLTFRINPSLITSWLVLFAPPVVAQASSISPELATGSGLLCSIVFALRWKTTHLRRDAVLSGLAAGLILGSSLNIISFGIIAGFILLAFGYRSMLRLKPSSDSKRGADWTFAAITTFLFAAPFLIINLIDKAHWSDPYAGFALDQSAQNTWDSVFSLSGLPSSQLLLDENFVGFGFAGLLLLLCAFLYLTRNRTSPKATHGFMWLGFSWIGGVFFLKNWIEIGTENIVPGLLMLSPGVAMTIQTISRSLPVKRYVGYLLLVTVSMITLGGTGLYLLKNTSRPLAPLLDDGFVPAALPTLPLLLTLRLSKYPLVNIDSDGVNESIFPFLAQGEKQRFTSHNQINPIAYNVLSRSRFSRMAPYRDIGLIPSYVLIAIPSKPTAGVEFLATVGKQDKARDYFGIFPNSGHTAPITITRSLLISIYKGPESDLKTTRIRVAGLNREDRIQLTMDRQLEDGRNERLAVFNSNDEIRIPISEPFRRLVFKALDRDTGMEVGLGAIPFLPISNQYAKPRDPLAPTRTSSIFVTDLIVSPNKMGISSEGLLPTEGPFPQWDIPFIRWAKQPSVRITIPGSKRLAKLEVSFSLRLHVRPKAGLAVFFNDMLISEYRMEGQKVWLNQTILLTPQAGDNVLEFRDSILKDEPDWRDYLDRYPDIEKHLMSENIPLEQGAKINFDTRGRAEGRTMKTKDIQPEAQDSFYFMFRNIRIEGFKGI